MVKLLHHIYESLNILLAFPSITFFTPNILQEYSLYLCYFWLWKNISVFVFSLIFYKKGKWKWNQKNSKNNNKMKNKLSFQNNLKCGISSLSTYTGLIQSDWREGLLLHDGERAYLTVPLAMSMPMALRRVSLEIKFSNREGLFWANCGKIGLSPIYSLPWPC